MQPKCLILGYGRAGRRHERDALRLGLQVFTADPDPTKQADYLDWHKALEDQTWQYVVIASPPKEHLAQLDVCDLLNVSTLCEKPLCDFGQLSALDYATLPSNLIVGYNWLWHPQIEALQTMSRDLVYDQLRIRSFQYRAQLPEWSLLLDHLSHALAMTAYITGERELVLCKVLHDQWRHLDDIALAQYWFISGNFHRNYGEFYLEDGVSSTPMHRVNDVTLHHNHIRLLHMDVQPNEVMFTRMWQDFVSHEYTRDSVGIAYATQRALEAAWQMTIAV